MYALLKAFSSTSESLSVDMSADKVVASCGPRKYWNSLSQNPETSTVSYDGKVLMPSWLALTPWTLSFWQACNSLSGNEREGTYFDRVVSKQNCVTILNYLQSIDGDSIFCLAPVHTAEFSAVLSPVKGAPRWTSSTMTPNAVTSACKYNFWRPATLPSMKTVHIP